MTTRRDLVEAEAWRRRRLVTAFLTGTPDTEPDRPGRVLLGSLVLALVLLAGVAIAAYL